MNKRENNFLNNLSNTLEKESKRKLNFLKNDIINKGRITRETLNSAIYPLLSDYKSIIELTGISDENYLLSLTNGFYINQINEKKQDNEYKNKIENIKKRFFNKKENNSYKHKKTKQNYEQNYINIIKKFNLEDIALNQILEFAIGDLFEDILTKKLVGNDNITKIKVIKTNEYDDVLCGTDHIIAITNDKNETEYAAYDFTTSVHKQIPTYKEKNGREREQKSIICRDFHEQKGIKKSDGKYQSIPREIIFIQDKEVVIKFLDKYIQEVQKHGTIEKGKALEIIQKIQNSESIIQTIQSKLLTTINNTNKIKHIKKETHSIPRRKRPRIKKLQ